MTTHDQLKSLAAATMKAADSCIDSDNQFAIIGEFIESLINRIPDEVEVDCIASEVYTNLPIEDAGLDSSDLELLDFNRGDQNA